MNELIPSGFIKRRIHHIRGVPVMLDSDLASFYGIPTHRLNEAVRRNMRRFPPDFMFRLGPAEAADLISQNAISSSGWGGRRKPPLVFTRLGVAMLSSILNSDRAIQVNIAIMRVFDRLRELLAEDGGFGGLVAEHEQRLDKHDQDIAQLMEAVPSLPEAQPKPVIGFTPPARRRKRLR